MNSQDNINKITQLPSFKMSEPTDISRVLSPNHLAGIVDFFSGTEIPMPEEGWYVSPYNCNVLRATILSHRSQYGEYNQIQSFTLELSDGNIVSYADPNLYFTDPLKAVQKARELLSDKMTPLIETGRKLLVMETELLDDPE